MTHTPRRALAATPERAPTRHAGPARVAGHVPARALAPEPRRGASRALRPGGAAGGSRGGARAWAAQAAAVTVLAVVAGLALPSLAPAPARLALPAPAAAAPASPEPGTTLDGTRGTTPAPPDTVTTHYAAGAFAAPQTGGMRLVPTVRGPLSGKVIVIDPGHNGKYSRAINERNYYTYGAGWRPCVQGGTTTYTGVTESQITWEIANRVVPLLLAKGATVVVTRADNAGYGPCNAERPEIANREGASLLLSLHVDGNETESLRGFHIVYSTRMAGGEAVQAASKRAADIAARHIRDDAGHPGSNYMGTKNDPTMARTDLAVLDGVRVGPAILVESGNSRNPDDVAFLTGAAGQQRYAEALAAAAEEIVLTVPADPGAGPASASPAPPAGVASRPPVTTTPEPDGRPSPAASP